MENFYREKHILRREKNRESDFAPSEKYSLYATDVKGLLPLTDAYPNLKFLDTAFLREVLKIDMNQYF